MERAKVADGELLSDPRSAAQGLQDSASEGYAPLCDWKSPHGFERRCRGPDNIVMTRFEQALEFLGAVLSPNDTALVEARTDPSAPCSVLGRRT